MENSMAQFKKCESHLFKWEGGWTNDPDDPGGATNRGLTLRFMQEYGWEVLAVTKIPFIKEFRIPWNELTDGNKEELKTQLKSLTLEETKKIYKETFWKWCQGTLIRNQSITETVFDFMVNADQLRFLSTGRFRSIQILQECYNYIQGAYDDTAIIVDGLMGEKTLEAINLCHSPRDLWDTYQYRRKNYYKHIAQLRPKSQKYLRGWLMRVEDLKYG